MRVTTACLTAFALLASGAAQALEFRSVDADAAVLYDAPSLQARKLTILTRNYPVEVIVALERWQKVRDATGALAWIESTKLSERRMLLVTAPLADVRARPEAQAPLVFQAEKDVALELMEIAGGGWARVKHRDGQSGYIQLSQVWGL